MSEVLQVLSKLAVLTFVLTSMIGMGLSLTVAQVAGPLRHVGLVVRSLVANFVVVPVAGFAILALLPLDDPLAIGLILLSTAAGAPFLPKLVQVAKGDVAFSVGLMVLLMVVTVAYVPLVLPLLLPGVEVAPGDIAGSLIVLMLFPLAAGLAVRARYPGIAATVQPMMAQTSSTALILLLVLMVVQSFDAIVGIIGTGALVALLLLIAVGFAGGYLLGGPGIGTRGVLALGTAQRNISAALVVGAQNFPDPDVVVMLLVGALLMLVGLMVVSGELARRAGRTAQATP
ncbi:MAG TPA: bile acid:sodium symporter [Euzebyales bacterium]|nr:bile acid:sodium symporter [Euzebyales bacterium]